MWKLYKLHFRYSKEDVWKAFSLTIRKRAFHCHLRHWEAYTVSFLSNQFYPCSSKDSKIHLHSLLENLMDVFPPPLHFPVLFSFNPPDGPLSTPNTVSFGLQSCLYTGGFKTCLKVGWKGCRENARTENGGSSDCIWNDPCVPWERARYAARWHPLLCL